MTQVVDASTMVAVLVDAGPDGRWAEAKLLGEELAAPHLLHAEVANILRRAVLAGQISDDVGALAFRDLLLMRIVLFPFEPLGDRVWELRTNLTAYDAWYVALAEHLEAPLVTLDRRLARAPGPRCSFVTPL